MNRVLPQLIVGALALSSCNQQSDSSTTAPPAQRDGAVAISTKPSMPEKTPRTTAEFPTDPGELALHNLEAQIDGQESIRKSTGSGRQNAILVTEILRHGAYTGRIADYELAEQRANELVKDAPKQVQTYEVMAMVDSTFHRFDAEAKDYDMAEKLGAKAENLAGRRMLLDVTRGKDSDAAYKYLEDTATRVPMLDKLMNFAVAQGTRGELRAAAQTFVKAQNSYRDVSPLPLAALYFQEGLMEQRSGSPARARELFANAHERLPQYAQATSHLASVLAVTGDKARAVKLLEPLATVDDPEYEGQLAALLDESDAARATKLRTDAATRYEALLKKYPLAFADHAARFYLSGPTAAQNGKRALELAQQNAKNRPTVEAERLVIDAAIAAGNTKLACTTADTLAKGAHLTPEAHVSASRAYTACGNKERAAAEVALVTSPK